MFPMLRDWTHFLRATHWESDRLTQGLESEIFGAPRVLTRVNVADFTALLEVVVLWFVYIRCDVGKCLCRLHFVCLEYSFPLLLCVPSCINAAEDIWGLTLAAALIREREATHRCMFWLFYTQRHMVVIVGLSVLVYLYMYSTFLEIK